MKFNLISLCTIILFLLQSCNVPQQEDKIDSLKVLTWNVWHGGHEKEYPEKGCEGTIGILKASEADIITMVETYGASDKVADSLGYYHRLISRNLSIYSRYPIVETYTFQDSISTFNFGGVMINYNGKKIRVFDTWLHYLPDMTLVPTQLSEEEIIEWEKAGSRDDEIKKIIASIKPYLLQADSIPVIVAGDFNVHSHLDWTDVTKDMYNHNGAVVQWPVSVEMEKIGFTDSYREMNLDVAKNIGTTWRYGQDSSDCSYRIDYIYYTGRKLKAVASESYNGLLGESYTFKGKEFFYASDHGFVLTTFDFD